MKICYHGTDTEDKATSILANGFNKDTWFAANLQDALGFGGPYVFEVSFDFDEAPNWQFHVLETISKEQIVRYTFYNKDVRYDNMQLRLHIHQTNMHRDVGEY